MDINSQKIACNNMNALIRNFGKWFCLALFFTPLLCLAHNWPVHQAISASAYQASGGLQTFISENLGTNLSLTALQPQCPTTPLTASNWLAMGSKMEDEQVYPLFTWRPLDHFYTVVPSRTPDKRKRVVNVVNGSVPSIIVLTIADRAVYLSPWPENCGSNTPAQCTMS